MWKKGACDGGKTSRRTTLPAPPGFFLLNKHAPPEWSVPGRRRTGFFPRPLVGWLATPTPFGTWLIIVWPLEITFVWQNDWVFERNRARGVGGLPQTGLRDERGEGRKTKTRRNEQSREDSKISWDRLASSRLLAHRMRKRNRGNQPIVVGYPNGNLN